MHSQTLQKFHTCVFHVRQNAGAEVRVCEKGFLCVCVLGGAEGTTYTVVASLALVQHQGSHNFSDLFKKNVGVTYVFETLKLIKNSRDASSNYF